MKDVIDLRVSQIRVYPIDTLPIAALAIEKNLAGLKEKLRFKDVMPQPGPEGAVSFVLAPGEMDFEGKTHLVERLTIEPQRVTFSIFGPSAVANAFYELVRNVLLDIDPGRPLGKVEPVIKTEETTCVVDLDVDFEGCFSAELVRFLRETVRSRTSSKLATSEVVLTKFTAQITYDATHPHLAKMGFRLAPKELTIEPRIRTLPKERRYFTKSPTDSETHLALLREFEKVLGAGGA